METDQAPSFLSLLNEPGRSFPSADTLKRKPVDYLPSAGKRSRDTGGSEHGFLPSNATAVPSQSSPLAGPSIDSLSTGDDPSKRHSFLLGDVLNDLDQTERDELSQVNWNREY